MGHERAAIIGTVREHSSTTAFKTDVQEGEWGPSLTPTVGWG